MGKVVSVGVVWGNRWRSRPIHDSQRRTSNSLCYFARPNNSVDKYHMYQKSYAERNRHQILCAPSERFGMLHDRPPIQGKACIYHSSSSSLSYLKKDHFTHSPVSNHARPFLLSRSPSCGSPPSRPRTWPCSPSGTRTRVCGGFLHLYMCQKENFHVKTSNWPV